MIFESVSPKALERVSRMYKTNRDAGAALGLSLRSYARACQRHGIETPHARRRKERAEARHA